MIAVFFVLLAKLVDPIGAIIGSLLGAFCHRWWQTLIVALIAAAIDEMILSALQYIRPFNINTLAIGFVAEEIWATIGYFIGQRRRNRKKASSPSSN